LNGAQGSATDSEREAVAVSPLSGPVAMYQIGHGAEEEVVASVKPLGGTLRTETEIVPDTVSVA
jgi:hypothetical protein